MRIKKHPILTPVNTGFISFTFDGKEMKARCGEVISSALFAHGIHGFKRHQRDGALQGIYCANGQCGQCLVLAEGVPVKACITPVVKGMDVRTIDGLPDLPSDDSPEAPTDIQIRDVEVLIVGAGPSGLSAAIELGRMGVEVLVVDDKHELGGKLSLQTHNFFGSIRDCFAGTRGMEIAHILQDGVEKQTSVDIWLGAPVVGVFSDKLVGVVRDGLYTLIRPKHFLVTTGAREKSLTFNGCDIPGVYGAGAFQTLVNRDLVKAATRLFIVGGGNVGLIAAYHAIQAGIEVIGLVEALPKVGGYKVHLDKIKRLGIPIFLSHTVLKAEGEHGHLKSVVTAQIDDRFRPISGTERRFEVDTLLIAVGLSPVNELVAKAEAFEMQVYSAGDAAVIAEASAAMFSGKITGRWILQEMGRDVEIPDEWHQMLDILRSKPGPTIEKEWKRPGNATRYPMIRCIQEIPCNPCSEVCPVQSISMPSGKIIEQPQFSGSCIACGKCVAICPGLAITVVNHDYDPSGEKALIMLPWELPESTLVPGMVVKTSGFEGERVGSGKVMAIKFSPWQNRRRLIALEVPATEADVVAGILIIEPEPGVEPGEVQTSDDEIIVCRCERVSTGEIRARIRQGAKDFNSIKAATRIGMGECGGKTCIPLVWRIFKEEGMQPPEVQPHVERPLTQEVPLKTFLKGNQKGGDK
jgi:NADPH-dependent 2,4-dienoyl-CoA reductase/sulfur reductase-like enzyme/Fe-S-cluster-containing hydrogenase component 2